MCLAGMWCWDAVAVVCGGLWRCWRHVVPRCRSPRRNRGLSRGSAGDMSHSSKTALHNVRAAVRVLAAALRYVVCSSLQDTVWIRALRSSKRRLAAGLLVSAAGGTSYPRVVEWMRGAVIDLRLLLITITSSRWIVAVMSSERCRKGSGMRLRLCAKCVCCRRASCARNVGWFFFGDTRARPLQRI